MSKKSIIFWFLVSLPWFFTIACNGIILGTDCLKTNKVLFFSIMLTGYLACIASGINFSKIVKAKNVGIKTTFYAFFPLYPIILAMFVVGAVTK